MQDINKSGSILGRVIGKVKSQLNSIFKIIEAKANVPKQFSAAGNGRFRDVGIRTFGRRKT